MSAFRNSHSRNMAVIHIAKRDLAFSEEEYRVVIEQIGGSGSSSAKDLGPIGINKVLDHFKSLGWQPSKLGSQSITKLGQYRASHMASQRQLSMLLSMWKKYSRLKTEASFNHFLQTRFGIDHFRFLPARKVQAVKLALENIKVSLQSGSTA